MNTQRVPPEHIPEELFDEFTLNNTIPVMSLYCDDRVATPVHNLAETYDVIFRCFEKRIFRYYGQEVNSFYDALEDYDVRGKRVLVWGLVGCNCEALALWKGAEEVYIVDYNKPVCDHPRAKVVTHEELKALPFKFDYAISFSSFEHDGLGRYGEPVSPFGDIKAMQQAKKVMKDGGILFLGVPLGRDALVWNAHRIYGKERLPLLLRGWLPVNLYSTYMGDDIFSEPLGSHIQPLLALKRTPWQNVPGEELANSLHHAANVCSLSHPGTRDGKMLSQVISMVMEARP